MYNFTDPRKTKVELTPQDLADAARILSLIANARPRESGAAGERSERAFRQATAIVAQRGRRKNFFNASMFGEPAWDILLALYLAEARGERTNINTLTESSGAAPTTALRWMNYLENHQLISREEHPTDARAAIIRLTDKAEQALELYLLETLP